MEQEDSFQPFSRTDREAVIQTVVWVFLLLSHLSAGSSGLRNMTRRTSCYPFFSLRSPRSGMIYEATDCQTDHVCADIGRARHQRLVWSWHLVCICWGQASDMVDLVLNRFYVSVRHREDRYGRRKACCRVRSVAWPVHCAGFDAFKCGGILLLLIYKWKMMLDPPKTRRGPGAVWSCFVSRFLDRLLYMACFCRENHIALF